MSALLHKKTSNIKNDFYCLNWLSSFRTESKVKIHEKICKNKYFYGVEMQSDKMLYNFYPDLESLIKKVDGCANNPENYSTTKIGEHIPCGCSMSTILGFDHKKTNINCIVEKIAWKSFANL